MSVCECESSVCVCLMSALVEWFSSHNTLSVCVWHTPDVVIKSSCC